VIRRAGFTDKGGNDTAFLFAGKVAIDAVDVV